jgi:hypothetical protein
MKDILDEPLHYATDRRCYEGAPCSDLKKEWGQNEDLYKLLKKEFPTAWITWFPMERFFSGAYWGEGGKFHHIPGDYRDRREATKQAILYLRSINAVCEHPVPGL